MWRERRAAEGDEAVEQAGVFDFVAPAKRFDDALDMASTLTDVLDEVEILVAADLLDTDEHGWCPDPAYRRQPKCLDLMCRIIAHVLRTHGWLQQLSTQPTAADSM